MDGLLPTGETGALRNIGVNIELLIKMTTSYILGLEFYVLKSGVTQLFEWLKLNASIHPVIAAAILHFQFVSIHPFSDGNGHTTRVLTQLYLGLRDYDFRGALVLDSYYLSEKQEYYNALNQVQDYVYESAVKANLDLWIKYFCRWISSSAKILAAEVSILSSVLGVKQIPRKINQEVADLLSCTRQFGAISLAEDQDILPNVPRRTLLQRKLKSFADDGYLTVLGSGPSTTYHWRIS